MQKLFPCNRRTVAISILSLWASNAVWAQDRSLGVREKELHEKMLDILALVRGGTSYNEYAKQLPELVVLYDRYERSGGASLSLMLAKDNLLAARDSWERLIEQRSRRTPTSQTTPEIRSIELKIEQGREEMLQNTWAAATKQLASYDAEARENSSKKSNRTSAGKKPSATQ